MKHKIISITFLAAIAAVFFANLFTPPVEFSRSERRRLAQFPEPAAAAMLNGRFFEDFDEFAVDQAAGRETFRRIKAFFDLNFLRRLDNNDIFTREGHVFKTDYPVNKPSVLRLSGIINAMYDRYLDETNNVWHTLVPDKNYFLVNSGHLIMDYREMESLIRGTLREGIGYIDIFGDLSLDSYYRTDSHWRQEKIIPVARTLAGAIGFQLDHKPFAEHGFDRFYGVFYGQSALLMEPDTLIWLVSETTGNTVVTSAESPGRTFPVYDLTQLEAVDPYSIFMAGPAAIVKAANPASRPGLQQMSGAGDGSNDIQSPLNNDARRLIMFRDSFASALSPLLLDAYDEITLIDLRYIQPDLIGEFVDFTGADVLFIYSAGLYNNSAPVRGAAADSFVSPFVARGRIGPP